MEGVVVICLVSFNNKINIDHMTSQIYPNNLSKCINLVIYFNGKKLFECYYNIKLIITQD